MLKWVKFCCISVDYLSPYAVPYAVPNGKELPQFSNQSLVTCMKPLTLQPIGSGSVVMHYRCMTMLEALGMLWVALLAKLWQLLRAQQLL